MSLLSEDGIFEKAERAAYETRKARFEERIGLVNLDAQTQKALNGSLTAEDYFEIVKDHGLISDSTIGGDNIEDKGENAEGNHVYEVTTEEGDVFEVTIDDEGNVETEYQGQSDGLPPRITGIETSKTTNSITVKVIVSRLEGGEISYYIKKASEEEYPDEAEETSKDTSYTFEGLEQNVTYDIKVVVENSKGRDEYETSEITGELATGAITQKGETVWNNGEATIELETTETEYTIQYKVGENGQWQEYKGAITGLNHNDKVYVRLWDGINGSGETAITITDGIAPSAPTITPSTTSTTTGASITATVTHTDNQSGVAIANCKYIYNTTSGTLGTTHSSWNSATSFESNPQPITLTASTPGTYYLHVLTVDNAGNKAENVSQAITVRQLVTGIILNRTSATITEGETLQLTATVSPSNASNKSLKWESNNTGVATVTTSGLVTAKTAGTATITVTTQDGSNKKATCKVTVESAGLSAGDIASNPTDNYGKTVTGYEAEYANVVGWKIFYAGNDFSTDESHHVYLIADNYIPYNNIPQSSAGHSLNASSSYPRAANFSNILGDYSGSSNITDANIRKLNNDYFNTKGYSSTSDNMKVVAYMLDTNAWSKYKGADADYAIGGPSIEMIMKSYSQKYGVDYRARAENPNGYQISNNGDSNWSYDYYDEMLSKSDSLYVIGVPEFAYTIDATGYWVASPSGTYIRSITLGVNYDGSITGNDLDDKSNLRFPPNSLSKF